MKNLKLCLVIPSMPVGGMERVMSEFANYLAIRDYEVYLIIMFNGELFYSLDSKVKVIQPSIKKWSSLTYAFYLFPYLRFRIKSINPHAVLVFGERYNSYLLLAAIGLKTPIYISDRSSPNKRLSPLNTLLRKVLYKRAEGIIAQTSQAAVSLHERLDGSCSNIKIIPNPLRKIDTKQTTKKNQIVAIGRLVKEKRYDRLLEVISKLENKTWNLVIVGEGKLRPQIENKIHELKLENRIKLVGQQTDIDSFLRESKIYVLSSDSEGYPNALCEAMAHGLACISFNCVAGPSDIIKSGENGILIEDGNMDLFARELDCLIQNERIRERFGKEAKKIQFKLAPNLIFKQYLGFIVQYKINF